METELSTQQNIVNAITKPPNYADDYSQITKFHMSDNINKLANKFTDCIDQIPSYLVKKCADCLVVSLYYTVTNLALSSSTFSKQQKKARICPVFKRVLEICLCDILKPYRLPILLTSQQGFVQGQPTISNLVSFIQMIESFLVSSHQVDVIYTDMSKASDCIRISLLLERMCDLGVPDKLLKLLKSD